MSGCIFCAIVAGDEPAERIYEDDDTLAFLDIAQATRGHSLVIPKRHRVDLTDIAPDELGACMRAAHTVAETLRARLAPSGINLFHATGATAWQTVFHFHVHVVPRYDATELALPWIPDPVPLDSLAPLAAQIRGE